MSFYSTWLHLPFRYFPGFVLLNPLVVQLDQSLLVVDLQSTIVVLFYWILCCSVPMRGDSSLLLSFLVPLVQTQDLMRGRGKLSLILCKIFTRLYS